MWQRKLSFELSSANGGKRLLELWNNFLLLLRSFRYYPSGRFRSPLDFRAAGLELWIDRNVVAEQDRNCNLRLRHVTAYLAISNRSRHVQLWNSTWCETTQTEDLIASQTLLPKRYAHRSRIRGLLRRARLDTSHAWLYPDARENIASWLGFHKTFDWQLS